MEKSKFIKIATSIGMSSFLLTGCGDYEEETAQQESTAVKTDGAKQRNEQETLNCDDKAPTNERKLIRHFHLIMKTLIYRYFHL